ncbi:hypothetical protein BJ508DRAFT_327407 [Ascobolus immersus RN42]|uniref:Uncharacterized protein n=1 Tax=Ascobolus immersus RN42 TaxID=1160509 RepID=A0A3N4I7Z5_ASCIM|nr:hypothetical protein BJ508DRAFT_327407 [Ascobolus immersus RN42]
MATITILSLPNELKIAILCSCSITSGSLFDLCKAIPAFNNIYLANEATIQRRIQKDEDIVHAVQLLDRFRLNGGGMGRISLEIFARIHIHDLSVRYHQPLAAPFVVPAEMTELRKLFGLTPGVIQNEHEVDFIQKILDYVNWMYATARELGIRSVEETEMYCASIHRRDFWNNVAKYTPDYQLECIELGRQPPPGPRNTWPDHDIEDQMCTISQVRKALFQFLILSTHYHSKEVLRGGSRGEAEGHRSVVESGLDEHNTVLGDCWYNLPPDVTPLYDFTYIRTVSLPDLVKIISVCTPLTNLFYRQYIPVQFLRVEVAERTGIRIDVSADYTNEEAIVKHDPDVHDELFTRLVEATDAGAWTHGYFDKLEALEEAASRLFDGWTDQRRAEFHDFFREENFYTTVGISEVGPGRTAGGLTTGTVVTRPLVVTKLSIMALSEVESEDLGRSVINHLGWVL